MMQTENAARAPDMDRSLGDQNLQKKKNRKKQKKLTVSRAQMPETHNEMNRVELSSCTLPNFKVLPRLFSMVIK